LAKQRGALKRSQVQADEPSHGIGADIAAKNLGRGTRQVYIAVIYADAACRRPAFIALPTACATLPIAARNSVSA
jgi:hypothetical protein